MKRSCVTTVLFAAALIALPLGTGAWAQSAAPAGDAKAGQQLFERDGCYQCHGHVGQGGNAGLRLGPPPIAYEAFKQQLRHPRQEMPPYEEKILSDREAADIYAYLQSLPKPLAVKDIPLLND
jgi:mono/diheme cytochrome c family protein